MSTAKENPCRKFQANFFNKSKCQNCFKPRELHLLTDQDLTQVSNACYEYNIKISYILMPKRTIILPNTRVVAKQGFVNRIYSDSCSVLKKSCFSIDAIVSLLTS